jgi:hypothetical protein
MDKFDDLPMDFCDASLVYLAVSLKKLATLPRLMYATFRFTGYPAISALCMCSINSGCIPAICSGGGIHIGASIWV